MAKRTTPTGRSSPQKKQSTPLTLLDHIHELQGRLFSIGLCFLAGAGLGYFFFRDIEKIILAPYDKGQDLVYLTPGGAIGFMMQVCAYVGIVFALPAIIFHTYRFIMPAVKATHLRTVVGYTISSLMLAVLGIIFAYIVSLPASLYFLTSFNLEHINPMLTVDAYFSFVMTYMFAGALLFQLPLLMLIINGVTPLTPKKLMGKQRIMIVVSFIVAAVISPTPDALNQTLLASPVIVMYQIGIVLIWIKNRKRAKITKLARETKATTATIVMEPAPVVSQQSLVVAASQQASTASVKNMDGIIYGPKVQKTTQQSHLSVSQVSHRARPGLRRSVDGVSATARPGISVPARVHNVTAVRLAPTPGPVAVYIESSRRHVRTMPSPFGIQPGQALDGVIASRRV